MKTITRSAITKTVIFLLILTCVAAAIVLGSELVLRMQDSRSYVFDSGYESSRSFWSDVIDMNRALDIDDPAEAAEYLDSLGYAEYRIDGETGSYGSMTAEEVQSLPYWIRWEKTVEEPTKPSVPVPEGAEVVANNESEYTDPAEENDYESYSHHMDDGTLVYSFERGVRYSYYNTEGRMQMYENDWEGSWTVYLGMSASRYHEMKALWEESRKSVLNYVYLMGGIAILTLLLLIYLLWVCGRSKEDEELHMLLIDRAPVEFTATIGLISVFAMGMFCVYALEGGLTKGMMDLFFPIALTAGVGAAAVFIVTCQSLVRNMKNSTFVSRLLSWRIIKSLRKRAAVLLEWVWKKLGRMEKSARRLFSFVCGSRVSVIIMTAFAIYTLAMLFFAYADMLPVAFVVFVAVEILIYRWLVQLDKIQRGIKEIRGGNTDYKITGCTAPIMIDAAEGLNSINEGVKVSVEREVKAQRMKSELITNVSHDLKTPLTSIISYADLLAGMELAPKEANDYARIIKQKGDRLKKLTADLFDISKAESGNETIEMERLDMALLLRQSMAELNNEIEKSGLIFVPDIPEKEVVITADGKKLSRVFENLMINALKYSMSGTRVYVSLKNTGGKAIAEIKNISAVPMNFDPAEITERFVRGDSSRTTEGSGLGLAIARSYTELCGGSLEIAVDGDLFKVTVRFKAE